MAVLYPSKFKQNNLGDILINTLLIRELSKSSEVLIDGELTPETRSLVQINNPFAFRVIECKNHFGKIGRYPLVHWLNLIPNLSKINTIYDTPGHITNRGIKGVLKLVKDLARAVALKSCGFKLVKIGVTLDPDGRTATIIQKMASRFYSSIAVRDELNFNKLQSLGFSNILLADDLAILYRPDTYGNYTNNHVRNGTLCSFRWNIVGSRIDEAYFKAVKQSLEDLLSHAEIGRTEIHFAHQVEEDQFSSQLLYDHFKGKLSCKLHDDVLDIPSAECLYRSASLVLTNRLHVALLAALNGAKAIIITDLSKHHKVGAFEKVGFSNAVFDFTDISGILGACTTAAADFSATEKSRLLIQNIISQTTIQS